MFKSPKKDLTVLISLNLMVLKFNILVCLLYHLARLKIKTKFYIDERVLLAYKALEMWR